jgi:hypothetical protein
MSKREGTSLSGALSTGGATMRTIFHSEALCASGASPQVRARLQMAGNYNRKVSPHPMVSSRCPLRSLAARPKHTYRETRTNIRTHTRTRTRTHAHTHTHTHTHTHKETLKPPTHSTKIRGDILSQEYDVIPYHRIYLTAISPNHAQLFPSTNTHTTTAHTNLQRLTA